MRGGARGLRRGGPGRHQWAAGGTIWHKVMMIVGGDVCGVVERVHGGNGPTVDQAKAELKLELRVLHATQPLDGFAASQKLTCCLAVAQVKQTCRQC